MSMGMFYDVVIIGGGAAGLFLASQLDRRLGCAVVECNARVGKKLLVTGNGKCNLSADPLCFSKYNDPQFAKDIITKFDFERTTASFAKMGLLVKNVEGRIYPYSESAATVLDALKKRVEERGTTLLLSHRALGLKRIGNRFALEGVYDGADGGKTGGSDSVSPFSILCSRVVLASGSAADFGTDSVALYEKSFGHDTYPRRPSLVPIKTEREGVKGLEGVRAKVALTLGDRREYGEVLFKNFGVSGIAALNISATLARGRAKIGDVLYLDFMPDYAEEQVIEILLGRGCEIATSDVLSGILHSRIVLRLLGAANVSPDTAISDCAGRMAHLIKNYPLRIEGLGDPSLAQVMCGGLKTEQFDNSLCSRLAHGAYAIGEALNIDGECGGYNLQWAWSSAGVVADALNADLI